MTDINEFLKAATFDHMCVLVNDIDKAVASLELLPDSGPWEIKYFDYSKDVYEVGSINKVKVAYGKIGGVNFEVAQPIADPEGKLGTQAIDFLKTHGEGLHHIAYNFATEDAFDKMANKLINAGCCVLMKCELLKEKGTPNAYRLKAYHLKPAAGGIIFEISVHAPVNN